MKKALFFTKLVGMGIPPKFVQNSWNDFTNDNIALQKCQEYVSDFNTNYLKGIGLYLYGEFGRGKTMLESLVSKYIVAKPNFLKRPYKITFYLFEELMQMIRLSRYNIQLREKLEKDVSKIDLLILDNLGSEITTKNEDESNYATKTFEYFLRKRDFECKPTIISSNIYPSQISKFYSESVSSLIEEKFISIKVNGENFREINGEVLKDLEDI